MARYTETKKNKLIPILIITISLLLITGLVFIFYNFQSNNNVPSLYMETTAELEAMSQEEFYIDLKLTDFPENAVYPAVSFALDFDNNLLEFTEIRLGTMSVGDEAQSNMLVPTWTCNTDISNETGKISAMYLDMTAEDKAYRSYGFEKNSKDILVRLQFKLKDSACSNDEIKFIFSDAVLASVNNQKENSSLSMIDKTLSVKDFTIKVK